jgi:hypothetical protein
MLPPRRSERVKQLPKEFWKVSSDDSTNTAKEFTDEDKLEYALMMDTVDNGGFTEYKCITPNSYLEALKSEDWMKATRDEYQAP